MWLHNVADLLVGLAYVAIPLGLAYFVRRRKDTPFNWIFWMFAAFILSCGATHFVEVLTTYVPLYRLSAVVKFETAVVSWLTFAAMIQLTPRALALPRREELEREVRERTRVQGELVSARELLEERVVERTAELARANRELDRSNRDLDDFAHVASHDLKEPLRGISNYSRFLLEDYGEKLDAEGRAKLQTLTRLARSMDNLIDSLLEYSRVGRVDLAIAPTDLNQVIAEVLDSTRIAIEEQGGEVRIPRPLPVLRCDRARVGEIFRNLITNAVKY
ncbi:MAG: sensor histidine kinase, partial [Thermoanaerobaculia bacterium]